MFLDNFFSFNPKDSQHVLVTGDCPFCFYGVQDSYDLYAKKNESLLMTWSAK